MSDHARAKAEEKIGLASKIASLRQQQLTFDVTADTPPSSTPEPSASTPDDVGPSAASAEESPGHTQNMKLRSALISALKEHIFRTRLSQSQAAKVFGVTQPRISDLNREKVDLFGLDALVNMAAAAGLQVEMQVRKLEQPHTPAPAP
jgi:predicted XRE-type DNA-binding protein